MRPIHLALFLSCALITASCVQNQEERSHDLDEDGDRIGEAVSAESKQECIEACKGGAESMEAFCRSLPPDPRLRAGCWGVVLASQTACIGWCLWHF